MDFPDEEDSHRVTSHRGYVPPSRKYKPSPNPQGLEQLVNTPREEVYTPAGVSTLPTPKIIPGSIPSKLEFKPITHSFEEGIQHMERRMTGRDVSFITPWTKLNDNILAGIPWHSLVVIAARPSHGKTLVATQLTREGLGLNTAHPIAVLDIQLEMLGKNMAIRELSMHFHRSVKFFNNAEKGNELTPGDIERARRYSMKYKDKDIYVHDTALTVAGLEALIDRFWQAFKMPFIVTLDHTLLLTRERGQSFTDMLNDLCVSLTHMKRKYPVIFVVLSQLKREIETQDRLQSGTIGNYVQSSDIFGADAIQMHADVVLGMCLPSRLNLTEYGPERYIVTPDLLAMHILKCRDGAAGGIIFYRAEFNHMRISEWLGEPAKLGTIGAGSSGYSSKPRRTGGSV